MFSATEHCFCLFFYLHSHHYLLCISASDKQMVYFLVKIYTGKLTRFCIAVIAVSLSGRSYLSYPYCYYWNVFPTANCVHIFCCLSLSLSLWIFSKCHLAHSFLIVLFNGTFLLSCHTKFCQAITHLLSITRQKMLLLRRFNPPND